jgi:hypothetical protein
VGADYSSVLVGQHAGMGDVGRFRATVDLFAELDNRFGGGHARESLIKYLSTDADRLLNGQYDDEVGHALFSTVGALCRGEPGVVA